MPPTVPFYDTDWFRALVYLVLAIVVARVADFVLARRDRALEKLVGRTPDRGERTRYVMIRRLTVAAVLFVGVAMALLQFTFVGSLARAMLASAAIMAGVIGIAARAPIANLVSGVMIAFSQPVRLKDYISVDGEFGTVERISLTYTYIRAADGRRIVIPNERFASSAVHNYSMGSPGSVVSVDVALPLGADVRHARDAMVETGRAVAPAPEGREAWAEVAEIGADGVLVRLHAWSEDPLRRRELASDLRAALLEALAADGSLGGATRSGGG